MFSKQTPLHEAARNGNLGILKFILEEGADISRKTNDGGTVLNIARRHAKNVDRKTHEEVMAFLKSRIKEKKIQFNSFLR